MLRVDRRLLHNVDWPLLGAAFAIILTYLAAQALFAHESSVELLFRRAAVALLNSRP